MTKPSKTTPTVAVDDPDDGAPGGGTAFIEQRLDAIPDDRKAITRQGLPKDASLEQLEARVAHCQQLVDEHTTTVARLFAREMPSRGPLPVETPPSVEAARAWLDNWAPRVREALDRVDSEGTLSPEERASKLADLDSEERALHVELERYARAREDAGEDVDRRGDAPPEVVLLRDLRAGPGAGFDPRRGRRLQRRAAGLRDAWERVQGDWERLRAEIQTLEGQLPRLREPVPYQQRIDVNAPIHATPTAEPAVHQVETELEILRTELAEVTQERGEIEVKMQAARALADACLALLERQGLLTIPGRPRMRGQFTA